jgi:hypothetical protein
MMYTKSFENKYQMINYFNKVRANKAIAFCTMGLNANTGWTVNYSYKKIRKLDNTAM